MSEEELRRVKVGESRGVNGSQRSQGESKEVIGVKESQGESRGVKGSQGDSRGVNGNQGEPRGFNCSILGHMRGVQSLKMQGKR